ncbi:MAG: hypothetical protein J6D45_08825 [Clostridia bacterium]|nr:hypothetical protein [Clostridia bacterium]
MKRKMTFILVLSVWLILCAAVTYLSVWAFPMVREEMNIDTVINLLGDDCADIGSGMLILQWKNWKGELTVNFYKPDATFKVYAFSISRSALFVSVYAICAVAFIITTAFLVVLFLKKKILSKGKQLAKQYS